MDITFENIQIELINIKANENGFTNEIKILNPKKDRLVEELVTKLTMLLNSDYYDRKY